MREGEGSAVTSAGGVRSLLRSKNITLGWSQESSFGVPILLLPQYVKPELPRLYWRLSIKLYHVSGQVSLSSHLHNKGPHNPKINPSLKGVSYIS